VSVVYCQVEVSASDLSLVQRTTACGLSGFNCEASIMRRPWTTRGRYTMERKKIQYVTGRKLFQMKATDFTKIASKYIFFLRSARLLENI
jgi:hypothetical protein